MSPWSALSPLLSKLGSLNIRPPHPEQNLSPAVVQAAASSSEPVAAATHQPQLAASSTPSAAASVPPTQNPPAQAASRPAPKKALRLILIDSAGVRRCRVVPGTRIMDVLKTGVGIGRSCMALPVHAASPAVGSGLSSVGEVCMVPVPDRVVDVPWCPGHVMAPVCLQSQPGVAWQCCPRTALQRAITGLHDEYGLTLHASFASQFVLLRSTDKDRVQPAGNFTWTPACGAGINQSQAVDAFSDVLDEMCEALTAMGVPVLEWHADASPGQFTISTGQLEVLAAADNLLLTREAISGVAHKHGLFAVFAPRFSNAAAGGCPCFLSLYKGDECVMVAPGAKPPGDDAPADAVAAMSQEAHHFFGGILASLPVMLPFTSPAFSSYQRLAASNSVRAWGVQHAGTPVSLVHCYIHRGEPPAVQVRLGVMDGATNPYIGLAAIIAGGLLGFLLRPTLPPPLEVPVASLNESQLQEIQATKLPGSLDEALQGLQADNKPGKGTLASEMRSMMSTLLSQELLSAYLAVRRAEADAGAGTMLQCLKY